MQRRCYGCMEEYPENYDVCPHCGYMLGTRAEEAYHLVPGTELMQDRYIVGKVLGFGGFGITYIGYDTVLQQKVAIKEYLPSECSTRSLEQTEVTVFLGEKEEQFNEGMQQFVEEARRLAKLQNVEGIVRIFDSFMENGTAYLVMEYLEGESLKSVIERQGKLSVEKVAEYIIPVLKALEEVHKTGILHRDIAPDNIFITKAGAVKLLDFGAARFASTNKSKSLSVILKPGYSPEEQYRSRGDQGPWTDVYAVAATFYKALTGITPPEAMERGEKDTLKEPRKLGIKIDKNMENALLNAMNIRIEDRTASPSLFLEELQSHSVERRANVKKKIDIGRLPFGAKIAMCAGVALVLGALVLVVTDIAPVNFKAWESISVPEGQVRVPNVINMDLDEAIDKLKTEELDVEIADKQYSNIIPENKVLTQNVEAGEIVDAMTKIEVIVSGGQEMVVFPDLTDYMLEDAVAILEGLNITSYKTEEMEGQAAPGAVCKQSVSVGEEIATDVEIVLGVSTGCGLESSKQSEIPDVLGLLFGEAKQLLMNKGIYLVKAGMSTDIEQPEGKILEQETTAGEKVNRGSVLRVTINEGYKDVIVPDVQYKAEAEAVELLESKTLTVKLAYEKSDDVKEGCVISQSIADGDEVALGSEITLTICRNTQIIDWTEDASLVNDPGFTYETKTQYRTQTRTVYSETTTSSSSSMAGWNLIGTSTTEGDWGAWSGWSTNAVSPSNTRQVETTSEVVYDEANGGYMSYTKYRYRDRTVSTVYQFSRNTYSDWSAWSDWSETPAEQTDLCNVETKILYRYTSK